MKKIVFIICTIFFLLHVKSVAASLLIEEDTIYEKQHGVWRTMFVHEDYYINPFHDFQIIVERDDENILRYIVWWREFWPGHSLFIDQNDAFSKRTLQAWTEQEPWIYTKIILKENTYERIDWVYTPTQLVGATEYYRVEYHHDTTEPNCSWTFFSHDEVGTKLFQLPEYRWFNEPKYAFFLCEDRESWCLCEDNSDDCFISWNRVFSTPQKIPHGATIHSNFFNSTWLEWECTLQESQYIYYDTIPPDISILIDEEIVDTSLREYVSLWWRILDGEDISNRRYYKITEDILFKADSNKDIVVQVSDFMQDSEDHAWVSWVKSIDLQLFHSSENWYKKRDHKSFAYQWEWLDTRDISLHSISSIRDTFSRAWKYQIYVSIEDFAGNKSRVGFNYRVIPWDIDPTRVVIRTKSRHMKYADNTDYYNYSITLRDNYGNIIPNKEIFNLEHNCNNQPNCKEIFQHMTDGSSSWRTTLDIFNTNYTSDEEGNIYFSIRSIAPWVFTESFNFELYIWDENYQDTQELQTISAFWNENTFLSPITWKLLSEIDGTWQETLLANQETQYFLTADIHNNLNLDFTLSNDFESYINTPVAGSDFTLSWSLNQVDGGIIFSGIFSSDVDTLDQTPYITINDNQISPIILTYIMWWYEITRNLSSEKLHNTPITLRIEDNDIDPVKVIWLQTWVDISSENWEISTMSSSDVRNNFRRDVLRSLQSRIHNTTVDWVKYINGTRLSWDTYSIAWTPDFETLIVRDANIVIENNFNIWWSPVGIISVTSNAYSVENQWYQNIWNIYIDAQVWQIHAMMYADWAVVSTINWSVIPYSSSQRSEQFWNQLYIKWSIFSRNTVWWSQMIQDTYILPGGIVTQNRDLAAQYDFEQLRQWNNNCYEYLWVCRFPNYTIIEYDSRIISSPPPFFNQ